MDNENEACYVCGLPVIAKCSVCQKSICKNCIFNTRGIMCSSCMYKTMNCIPKSEHKRHRVAFSVLGETVTSGYIGEWFSADEALAYADKKNKENDGYHYFVIQSVGPHHERCLQDKFITKDVSELTINDIVLIGETEFKVVHIKSRHNCNMYLGEWTTHKIKLHSNKPEATIKIWCEDSVKFNVKVE